MIAQERLHKYRVRVTIDRIDEPGTESTDIHLGVVHATEITPIHNFALQLTQAFGNLDEKAKA